MEGSNPKPFPQSADNALANEPLWVSLLLFFQSKVSFLAVVCTLQQAYFSQAQSSGTALSAYWQFHTCAMWYVRRSIPSARNTLTTLTPIHLAYPYSFFKTNDTFCRKSLWLASLTKLPSLLGVFEYRDYHMEYELSIHLSLFSSTLEMS